MSDTLSKFGSINQQLISEGIISEAQLKTAQTEAQQQKTGLISYLVENRLANPYQIAQMMSASF